MHYIYKCLFKIFNFILLSSNFPLFINNYISFMIFQYYYQNKMYQIANNMTNLCKFLLTIKNVVGR